MIKVDDIAYNNRHGAAFNQRKRKLSTAPSFTARAVVPNTLMEAVEQLSTPKLRMLKKLGSQGGEIQNIIINSIGTGIVAPIFIKYNWLSKTDEDTRTYSAWRQPVSAVLAVVTQCGLTAPFYKIFDNWANTGVFGEKLNFTLFNDDYYLTKLIKRTNPNATKSQIADMLKQAKANQHEQLVKTLREESTVKYKRADGKTEKISGKEYRALLEETVDKQIAHDTALRDELRTTIQKRTIRSNYYRNHNEEARTVLNELLSTVEKAENVKDIDSFVKAKISQLRSNPDANEMIALLSDIQKRSHRSGGHKETSFKNIKVALKENVEKMLNHVEIYSKINTEDEVIRHVQNSVKAEILEVEGSIDFFSELKKSLTAKTSIADIQRQIDEKRIALNVKTSSLSKDFAEETAKQLIERTKAHMKCYKQIVGVFVSLAVLPFTCTLLNWIYPRFMDMFFPNLSSKKHENESSKLISKAPKKAEVA